MWLLIFPFFGSHHVKKGKLCFHAGSDDGPGPGTYSSRQRVVEFHSDSIINTILILIKIKINACKSINLEWLVVS